MTSTMLQDLLKCISILGGLLLTGTFLRAKVPLFQKLLLPASVIGGLLGLILGPVILGDFAVLRVPEDYISIWSLLPGILIIPIFSSTPLGMFQNKSPQAEGPKRPGTAGIAGKAGMAGKKSGGRKTVWRIMMTMGITAAAAFSQNLTGYGVNLAYTRLVPSSDLYRTFGWELREGFCGGHGTAGAVGSILEGYGIPYWQTAQGVAMTTATVGLIGGMFLGILLIRRAGKQGKLSYFDTSRSALPEDILKGFSRNPENQRSLGKEITASSSVETISIHLAVILGGCGISFLLRSVLGRISAVFGTIPVWFYGILVMYGINWAIQKAGLTWLIDKKVKSAIVGTMSDFAITAAIASVPVQAVFTYAVPLFLMCALGFLLTWLITFPLFSFCFHGDHAFERAIITWGTNTGVMITGLMLLRICDPDYESPALGDFTMCYPFISILTIAVAPAYYELIRSGSTMDNFLFALLMLSVFLGLAMIGKCGYVLENKKCIEKGRLEKELC